MLALMCATWNGSGQHAWLVKRRGTHQAQAGPFSPDLPVEQGLLRRISPQLDPTDNFRATALRGREVLFDPEPTYPAQLKAGAF